MKTFSVKEIADLLEINPETVRRWIRDGKLKSVQISRKKGNKIAKDDLQRFLKSTPKYSPMINPLHDNISPLVNLAALSAEIIANIAMDYYNEKNKFDTGVLATDFKKYLIKNLQILKDTVLKKKSLIFQTEKEIESLQKQILQYQQLIEHDEIIIGTIKNINNKKDTKEE